MYDDEEEEDMMECANCGTSLNETEAWDFKGGNYCEDCYNILVGEEEDAENYTGPNADSNGICDYCGKSRIYHQCTCY